MCCPPKHRLCHPQWDGVVVQGCSREGFKAIVKSVLNFPLQSIKWALETLWGVRLRVFNIH